MDLSINKNQILFDRKTKLDPRTKLLLLITVAIFALGGAGGNYMWLCNIVLCTIPLILLALDRNWKPCLIYVVVYILGYEVQKYVLPLTSGLIAFLLLALTGILTKMLPGIMMGRYVISTTTVSEFVAAMEKMHMTEKITIPMSVIFRFFPTIVEEYTAINNAMRMRGVSFGGKKPSKMLEYRFIPMMTCSVKIGEELSAAALTRGLGAPIKRTNICKIGFSVLDMLLILICIAIYVFWIVGIVKGLR